MTAFNVQLDLSALLTPHVRPAVVDYLVASKAFARETDDIVRMTTKYPQDARQAMMGALCRYADRQQQLATMRELFHQLGLTTNPANDLNYFREHDKGLRAFREEQELARLPTVDLAPWQFMLPQTNVHGLTRREHVGPYVFAVTNVTDAFRELRSYLVGQPDFDEMKADVVALLETVAAGYELGMPVAAQVDKARAKYQDDMKRYCEYQKKVEATEREQAEAQARKQAEAQAAQEAREQAREQARAAEAAEREAHAAEVRVWDTKIQELRQVVEQQGRKDVFEAIMHCDLPVEVDDVKPIMQMLELSLLDNIDTYAQEHLQLVKVCDDWIGRLAVVLFPGRFCLPKTRYDSLSAHVSAAFKSIFGDEGSKAFNKEFGQLKTAANRERLNARKRSRAANDEGGDAARPAQRRRTAAAAAADPTTATTDTTDTTTTDDAATTFINVESLRDAAELERMEQPLMDEHHASLLAALGLPDADLELELSADVVPNNVDRFLMDGLVYTTKVRPEVVALADYISDKGLVGKVLRRLLPYRAWLDNKASDLPPMAPLTRHKASKDIEHRNQLTLQGHLDRLMVQGNLCSCFGSAYVFGPHKRVRGAVVSTCETIADWVQRNTKTILGITKELRAHLTSRYTENELPVFPTRRDWSRDFFLYQDGYVRTDDPRFKQCQTAEDFAALLVPEVPPLDGKLPFFVNDCTYETVIEQLRAKGTPMYDGIMAHQGYGENDGVGIKVHERVLDEDGNPVLDEAGKPVTKKVRVMVERWKRDEAGRVLLDAEMNPLLEKVKLRGLSSKEMLLALLGSGFFALHQHDNWEFVTVLFGLTGGTSKSSVLKAVLYDAYPAEQVCAVDTSGENNRFRWNDLLRKKGVVMDLDAREFVVDKVGSTDFQKGVEGGVQSVEVKNVKGTQDVPWFLRWFLGSNFAITQHDSGGYILRRSIIMRFNNKVAAEDADFKTRFSKEEGPALRLLALAHYWRLNELCSLLRTSPTADAFPRPKEMQADRQDARERNSPVLRMILGSYGFTKLALRAHSRAWIKTTDLWGQMKAQPEYIKEFPRHGPPQPAWNTMVNEPSVREMYPTIAYLKEHHSCVYCRGPHIAGCCTNHKSGEPGRRGKANYLLGVHVRSTDGLNVYSNWLNVREGAVIDPVEAAEAAEAAPAAEAADDDSDGPPGY